MPDYGEPFDPNSATATQGSGKETELGPKMTSLFGRSVSSAQDYSSKIRQSYVKPALARAQTFSGNYPVLSLFIGIYSTLSLIPLGIFLFSTIFVLSTSVIVALTIAIVFSSFIISFFGFLLFCTLFWISLASISATALALAVWQLKQLVINLREEHTWQAGTKKWASELQQFAFSRLPSRAKVANSREPPAVAQTEGIDVKIEAD